MIVSDNVDAARKRFIFLVSPTHLCNLSCRHCYVRGWGGGIRPMSEDVLERVMQGISEVDAKPCFIWHGGEPLLAGVGFYERAVELQREYLGGQLEWNKVQTNGVLLDDDYAEFFVENGFKVSVSLDPPAEAHNSVRVTPQGAGTFQQAFDAVKRMKEYGGDVRAITILTQLSHDRVREVYAFMKAEKINFKANPLSPNAPEDLRITPRQYGEAMVRLFDLWEHDKGGGIKIKNLHTMIWSLKEKRPYECTFNNGCGRFICSITSDGSVYPCMRMHSTPSFRAGNILETPLNSLISKNFPPWRRDLAKTECAQCKWLKVCNGGCSFYAYLANGSQNSRDYYCEAYRMIFEHINGRLDLGW